MPATSPERCRFISICGGSCCTHSSLTAVQLVKEYRPDLLLIDSSIPIDDITSNVYNFNLENPSVRVIVIGDRHQQQRTFNKAGANFVVSTYEFKSQIKGILNQFKEMCLNAIDCDEEALDANI